MKKTTLIRKVVLLTVFSLFCGVIFSQAVNQYTPYDDFPTIQKGLKPAYTDDMPDWAKMLYQYPVNFNEINEAYRKWEITAGKVKNSTVRYYKLWRKEMEPYADAKGVIHLPDINRYEANLTAARLAVSQKRMQKAPAAGNTSNWTFLGPKQTNWLGGTGIAPWQANVYSFDVTESHPNTLYCGTETGYVNKTTDKGQTWSLCAPDYPFGGAIMSVAMHPTHADTVWVGNNNIHRTYDGGKTWTRLTNVGGANRIKVDYNNPNKLITSTWNGLWISANSGDTWTKRFSNVCWDVDYKPGSSDTIYSLTKTNTGTPANDKFLFLQSINGGQSFSVVQSFPDSLYNKDGGMIATTPKNPNIVYVVMLTRNQGETPFLYKGTLVGGAWKWELKYKGLPINAGFTNSGGLTNGQGYFDLVLEASPTDENMVYVGTTTLFKSTNGGTTFSAIGGYGGSFSIHPDIQDMKILKTGETWVSTDGGVNLSTDNFTTNHQPLITGLVGSDMWGFDQGWNEDIVVGGRYHNGNTAIADFYGDKALRLGGGESATGWVIQGKSRTATFDDLGNVAYILPKASSGNFEGTVPFSKFPNMDGYGSRRSNVVAHPYYSGQIYLGNNNSIWVTTNFGSYFDKLYEFPGRVMFFNISSKNPDVMYADIQGTGFYKTEDGGVTWIQKKSSPGSLSGDMMFAISPYNENVVYAFVQNSISQNVYKTTDGGASWVKWSDLAKPLKGIVIQPTNEEKDLVYVLSSASGGSVATVDCRKDTLNSTWMPFNNNFPSSYTINFALPFFRDSKIRVGGNGGVWETPLAEPEFRPIIIPWVEQKVYTCTNDMVSFNDHSLLNHAGATWKWEITPAPSAVSGLTTRTPKARFSTPGKYTVKLTVTKNGVDYSTTVPDMFEVKSCPSVNDCSNPGELPKNLMKLIYVDSYQLGNEGTKAFDGDASTLWHTPWGAGETKYPHEIQIDLGEIYKIRQMTYTPRTDGDNGRVKKFRLYISQDKNNWGTEVKEDSLDNTSAPSIVKFTEKTGRYARFVALSEVKGRAWTSVAELSFTGCKLTSGVNELYGDVAVKAFPVPATAHISIELPFQDGSNSYTYSIYSSTGQEIKQGNVAAGQTALNVDLKQYASGYYFVLLRDKNNITYRVKFIKK